jgi:hypothetical protein
LEGVLGKKYNKYVSLSEQQMVDCSTANEGCDGGDPQWVFTDIMSIFPSRSIYTNALYPVRRRKIFYCYLIKLSFIEIKLSFIKVYWSGRQL